MGVLSLTPLIDVIFLLIIFFLVAAEFAKEEHEMKIVLPSASEATSLVAPAPRWTQGGITPLMTGGLRSCGCATRTAMASSPSAAIRRGLTTIRGRSAI